MIAALASSSKQKPTATSQMAKMSSAQIKRKRSKLLDLLLNTNWSKQAQQASNLMKLNKILLACDANFIDEKSGESPLSLVICSPQINPTNHHHRSNGLATSSATAGSLSHHHQSNNSIGYSQSASLFNLQCNSSASHNQLTLKQTSAADICQSSAPLVERILLLIIKSGAQVDFRNKDDQTPLHVAALKSNFWALKTLLDLGASTDYRDINGLTPLYYSILHRAELKITQLLLNYNSRNPSTPNNNNIGITDQHGWQEVHQACKLGLDAHLDKLLYYGCDINAKISGSGNTPLHVAAINDQVNCAKVLLLRGADKTITNNSHQTAHQVAVISNNMDLAEFIAEHDDSKVVPFNERPTTIANFGSRHSSMIAYGSRNSSSSRFSTSSSSQLVNLHSIASSNLSQTAPTNQTYQVNQGISQRASIVQAQSQHRSGQLNPLSLDVPIHLGGGVVDPGRLSNGGSSLSGDASAPTSYSTAPTTSSTTTTTTTSGTQAAPSLLSINTTSNQNQQLNVQVNNISPCLSQRSCATSTNTATTSSSGVCCDGDGNNSAEELAHSQSRHSNITIISIGNNVNGNVSANNNDNKSSSNQDTALSKGCARSNTFEPNGGGTVAPTIASAAGHPGRPVQGACNVNNNNETSADGRIVGSNNDNDYDNDRDGEGSDDDDDDDLRSSESSSNGLYSLMSDERPLFAGSIVKATSEYQSGDPNHLQLHRGDLMEVLEYPAELIRDGQLPRLANKPLVFGRRQSDKLAGLFPSFCVRRHRQRQSSLGQRIPMTDLTNCNQQQSLMTLTNNRQQQQQQQQQQQCGIRGASLPDSQSMVALDKQQLIMVNNNNKLMADCQKASNSKFCELQVTLTKFNEGFGFVLRGARIDPSTLAARLGGAGLSGEVAIDENLMAANNLASLQYLDDIEPGSVAQKAGLKRGDFLVAVNGHDVRLSSHEQVVNIIRRSGDRVHLTIATAAPPALASASTPTNSIYSSKTLTRVKPEPPKRDPTTTLTRNKSTQRIKSMPIAPQPQQQQQHQQPQFDANKPLPHAPADAMASPTGSLNLMGRSMSSNLSHFHSAQSLSSGVPDTQSISSISTISSNDQHHQSNTSNSQHANASHHQTMNESSSSTTTLTTVATNKPKAPAKPNGIHLKAANMAAASNSSSSSTYQPAIITTNRRTNSPSHQSPVVPPPKPPTAPVTCAPMTSRDIQNKDSLASVNAAPPPPPPPPPLPDFSVTPTKDRLNQRRTSAPINQSAELIDRARLLKKRESLAVVGGTGSGSGSGCGPSSAGGAGSTQMSAVAAACAAAANSRLQRQRQRELELESSEKPSDQTPNVKGDLIDEDKTPENQPEVQSGLKDSSDIDETPKVVSSVRSRAADLNKNPSQSPMKSHEPPPMVSRKSFSGTQTMSASLGRRASAQIIQQPKSGGYMSQTLKPKPKSKPRPALPDYDDMPPPPPPLPSTLPEQQVARVEKVKAFSHDVHHHNLHQQHHQQIENQSINTKEAVRMNRQSQELSQQQLKQQQQQLIMRQQQLRQQQILLHQQQQHHNHRVQQQIKTSSCQKCNHPHDGQCYNATIARSQFNHEPSGPIQAQHPHHNHHQHAPATRSNSQHRHHQHHHHHHHGHQQQHQHEAADVRTIQRQQYIQTVQQHPIVQTMPASQLSSHHQCQETNYNNQDHHHHRHHHHNHHHHHQSQQQHHQQHNHQPQLHHHHHHSHQNQNQQQNLYQQLQQQQFIERYLPLVYSTDSYAATLER